jgi:hypothetical protein
MWKRRVKVSRRLCLFVAGAYRDCNGKVLMASLNNPIAHAH